MNSEKQSTNLQMTLREVNRVGEGQKNVPKLRFKGYEDAWEQRKLEDIADVSIGEFVIKSKQNDDAPYPVFNGGKECTGYYDEYNNEANKIVISARGANAGFVNIVEKRFWAGNSCYSISIKDEKMYHLYFLYQFIKFRESLFTEFQQAANIPSVSKKDVLFFSVEHPLFEEQNEIGNFYRDLDSLITLHQRKYDALKSMKKTLLSKMFPKNGEDVPEIRFKEFTDAWEQRSFKEITFLSGKKNKDNLPLESYSITNEEGFVPQNEHFENGGTMKDADKSMYIIVSANSFAYNPARINVGSIGYKADGEDVIVSSLYEVFKTIEDIDDNFLWRWFKSPHLQRLIMKFQEGGVRLYFYYNKLCLGYISVPEYREQNKISQTLGTLDNLITLHQRKLEELKNMKKTLLQQMFV